MLVGKYICYTLLSFKKEPSLYLFWLSNCYELQESVHGVKACQLALCHGNKSKMRGKFELLFIDSLCSVEGHFCLELKCANPSLRATVAQ